MLVTSIPFIEGWSVQVLVALIAMRDVNTMR